MDNLYEADMHEQWKDSLMGVQFWEDATRDAERLARNETQALVTRPTDQLPQRTAQSPSKKAVQTAVTSSPEKSPIKSEASQSPKKSRFQLSQLASFNSLRLRSIIHPSPAGTDTANSPDKSQKGSKKGSLHIPKLPSLKTLSLKRRGPILASTSGIIQVEKTTRPSILSPSTFLPPEPPESPIPPMPKAPRPAFRTLYRGPSATNMDIAPPSAPKDSQRFGTMAPGYLSKASFQEWLDRESDTHPETEAPPHSVSHSSRISLMACLNKGGSWDVIPQSKSVLELNMFFDAIKTCPERDDDLDDDPTIDEGTMADEVTMVGKAVTTDHDLASATRNTTIVDKATMTDFDIEGSSSDHFFTGKTAAETDDITKSDATIEANVPVLKESAAEQATANDEYTKGKAAVHDWDLYGPSVIRKEDLPIFDAPRYPDQEVMMEVAAPKAAKLIDKAMDAIYETATDDQATDHSTKKPEDGIIITILSVEQMRPLTEFRNLRELKLTGMMKSYQPIIWQTVWMNPQLTTLELEMAVGLEIKPLGPSGWKPIKNGWVMSVKSCAPPVYHGYSGNGEISHRIGYGEYLDKFCIERAKRLTLTGFAVDGDPFGMWFRNLKDVHFKRNCIDCGFWLPRAQRDVRVRHSNEYGVARGADGPSEAGSVVELGEEALAELTAAVRGLGVLRM
ncbi:hypothetical protein N7472_000049 [Penicillium cf. griseofulvum]|uniref:Uncharacterized protein n=1 Tax=Penicillium cf. griseofulvum TaxID=2972120 RepID=A0A9W9MYZ0_9EURO|nr:hypothetical protein N7472_000049 [Penicillium cf. griseofulvum]